MSENEEQSFVASEEHPEEQEDDLINSFELGEQLDTDGLWYISIFGFLRAAEIGKLLWPDTTHNQKNGQRICRKWLSKGYVIKRVLPSKAGFAYVLAAGGVRFLLEREIPSKSGKDWGKMEDGKWTPPREWVHHLMANMFLVAAKMQGYAINPEHQIRSEGATGKIPDGIYFDDDNVFVIEVEHHRKTGKNMEAVADSVIKTANQLLNGYGFRKSHPVLVYPKVSKDERNYKISHETRLINAITKKAQDDFKVELKELDIYKYNLISVTTYIRTILAPCVTSELERIKAFGLKEWGGRNYYYIGNNQDDDIAYIAENEGIYTVEIGPEIFEFENEFDAMRKIASISFKKKNNDYYTGFVSIPGL